MTSQPIAPSRPAPSVRGPSRHGRIRTAAAIAAIGALIGGGGYVATKAISPDAATPPAATDTEVHTSAQKLRELRQSIAGQYGTQVAAGAVVNPSAQTLSELRTSITGQYGSHSGAGGTVNPSAEVRRELRDSIAGQYGPVR
jgi:hypothetical protein